MATRKRWPIVLASVLGVLVIAVGLGLFLLDSILTNQARDQARKLSEQWGRPVEIGGVATKLFSGLAVRVTGVRVGPGPGEQEDLVQLDRAEVRAALLKALFSKGKEIEIKSAELQGLRVTVARYKDGTTNLERLQDKLAEQKKPEQPPEAKKEPQDLSGVRVDHAALREGRVAFIDKSGGGARELAISHLDVTVDDLRAGKPLELIVQAAVLAEQKNFDLRVKTDPLPPTLQPVPDHVTLKVQPIDLAPLAPFVPKSVGLVAGKLDADFSAALGAAVPGNTGKTTLKGAVHLLGLRFQAAEDAKPLDVVLETDVDADMTKGDVDLRALKLDLGPAGISGSGKASAVLTPTPRIEGLTITSHDLDPARLAQLYPPLQKQLKGQIAGPIGLSVKGAGTADKQQLEVRLDFGPVRLRVPDTLEKAAGAPMVLVARIQGAAQGQLRADVDAQLDGVDLRPGQSLNKAPGDKLELAMRVLRTAGGTTAAPTQHIDVQDLNLRAIDTTFTGKATADLVGGAKKSTKFEASLASDLVDLDRLLIQDAKKKEKPPPDPATFAGLSGKAEVRIKEVRMKKQPMRNVVAVITLQEDLLDVQSAEVDLFGGHASAAGTRMRLARPNEPMAVKLRVKDVDLEQATKLVTDKKVLAGKLQSDVDVAAGGSQKAELLETLKGALSGHVLDGTFYGKDVIGSVTGPLSRALPSALSGKVTQGGFTSLGKDLPVSITFENGRANLARPLSISTPQGQLQLTGGMRLDGTLDLPGTVALQPATISAITGGKAKVSEPIPVKLRLVGSAWSPSVTDLDLKDAVSVIAKSAVGGLLGSALGVPGGNVDDVAKAKQAEAENAAKAKADEAAKRAADEAEKRRKDVEKQAADKLKGLFGK